MLPPGALTFGLKPRSEARPQELKLEIWPASGSGDSMMFFVHVIVAVSEAAAARMASPSVYEIVTPGTPRSVVKPPLKFPTRVASAPSFMITTAFAQAATARAYFSLNEQTPRTINAALPFGSARYGSFLQPWPT